MIRTCLIFALLFVAQETPKVRINVTSTDGVSLAGMELKLRLYGEAKTFREIGVPYSVSRHGKELEEAMTAEVLKLFQRDDMLEGMVEHGLLDLLEEKTYMLNEGPLVIDLKKDYEALITKFRRRKEEFQRYDLLFFIADIEGYKREMQAWSKAKAEVVLKFEKE